jgi:hypothetical protein
MVDERLKEQYNQSVVELKEALKRESIFNRIYRNMIVIMDKLEKFCERQEEKEDDLL